MLTTIRFSNRCHNHSQASPLHSNPLHNSSVHNLSLLVARSVTSFLKKQMHLLFKSPVVLPPEPWERRGDTEGCRPSCSLSSPTSKQASFHGSTEYTLLHSTKYLLVGMHSEPRPTRCSNMAIMASQNRTQLAYMSSLLLSSQTLSAFAHGDGIPSHAYLLRSTLSRRDLSWRHTRDVTVSLDCENKLFLFLQVLWEACVPASDLPGRWLSDECLCLPAVVSQLPNPLVLLANCLSPTHKRNQAAMPSTRLQYSLLSWSCKA